MKHIVLSSEIAKIDTLAQQQFKLPALSLMECAAIEAWREVESKIPSLDASLVFLCGGGNNGGDALAIARHAYTSGYRSLLCVLSSRNLSVSCQRQREIVEAYGIALIFADETPLASLRRAVAQADVLFDGVAGTGLKGPLKGESLMLIELANASSAYKIAIDIPSGLGDEVSALTTHYKADRTVTFGMCKIAHMHPFTRGSCGLLTVKNPSFPPQLLQRAAVEAEVYTLSDISIPKLCSSSYKNRRGHLAIVGGSKEYTGAARLSARSAFASRAGLVTLFCDEDVYPIAASESPSVMVRILKEVEDLSRFNALLVGPGWGGGRTSLIEKILALRTSLVLDADGITALASLCKNQRYTFCGPMVLTPHLGELKTLAEALYGEMPEDTPRGFFTLIKNIAHDLTATLVVKSSLVHIASPGHNSVAVVEGLNPSLGVAGSGDVLSAAIAALMAGGMDQHEASLQGVLLHQEAGRVAHSLYGYYDSDTLIGCLGKVIMEAEQ